MGSSQPEITEEGFGIRRWQGGRWVLHRELFNTRKEARDEVRKFDVRCPGCGSHGHFARVVHVRTTWGPSGRALAISRPVEKDPS